METGWDGSFFFLELAEYYGLFESACTTIGMGTQPADVESVMAGIACDSGLPSIRKLW